MPRARAHDLHPHRHSFPSFSPADGFSFAFTAAGRPTTAHSSFSDSSGDDDILLGGQQADGNDLHLTGGVLRYTQLYLSSGCEYRVSHLVYADDIMILMNGSINGIKRVKSFLDFYMACSGQEVM
ncbi:uncharacterized protein LOC122053410 isoform X2 [Zingiber officinale]|uniref:uncharacterized protein LOC122053410 isoform X2 n=1 Tax=Zingiber officinale TaxID=94328 RepID=UPI001C4B4233|nr:uncharacterized protein LOC122053410 isoform X2 [Zingiber officinale]